jgi:small subunit ribosomal protein S2
MSEETPVPPPGTTPAPPPTETTPVPPAAVSTSDEEGGEAQSFEKSIEGVKLAFPTVSELLEAGVHFGHQTRRWDPRMRNYLFGDRNGVHIIDLDQTLGLFKEALIFVREITANGGKVLFVGTKRQAQPPIRSEAERAGQYYVNQRWLGGMLTNFKTVKNSVERFKSYLEILGDEEKMKEHTKRELARIQRETNKLEKSLGGIKTMKRLPDAVFVVGMDMEDIAIKEAHRLTIPVIGIADSNNNPDVVDFIIPGNDDATRAIQLYCSRVADACIEGAAIHQAKLAKEGGPARGKQRDEKKAEGPSTGRVVVDIKAPPKRGRGGAPGASAGGEKKGGRGKGKGKGKDDAKESVQVANPMAPRRRKKVEPKVEEAVTEEVVAAAEGEATETPAPEAVETQAPAVEETAAVTEAPAEEAAAVPAETPAETPEETKE